MDIARLEREHGLRARNYAASILRNWEDAEDVVLEAETRIAQRYPSHPQYMGESMLMRTTKRLCIDALRKRGRTVGTHPLELLVDELIGGTTPEDKLLAQERRDTVKDAVCELKPEWFSVIVCHYWHGWSLDTIAQMQQVRVGTIKSRLARARKALRERLQEVTE